MVIPCAASFSGIDLVCGIEDGAVVSLRFGRGEASMEPPPLWERVYAQLAEYFAGQRRSFDLPLRYAGTPFQRAVWEALLAIPYGETRTYGQLAHLLGRPNAARAVGGACHVNPICILIPCHRVVGAGGTLTGFAGGIEVKRSLLEMERGGKEPYEERIFQQSDPI